MDPSTFWHGRRTLVLGCTGFLGTHVVRALLERGAQVTGLIRDSQRPSEFFADKLHRRIRIVRGTADPQRLRSLIAVHGPAAVFQLASVSGQSHAKHRITAEFLRAVARLSPSLPVVVPVARSETAIQFRNHPLGQMRVGFVQLPSLFGAGNTASNSWASRVFANAARGRPTAPPERDEPLTWAADAADTLLEAAEWLTGSAEPPAEGLWHEPPATTTARELQARLANLDDRAPDALDRIVARTLAWYERHAPQFEQPIRAAA
jgi:NAD(P)-dependent dehydrogenase (short-subunit alcohol dehydrogenase family)